MVARILLLFLILLLPDALVATGNVGSSATSSSDDRVYLLTLPSLTFTTQALTTSRRGSPHPQLDCIGGDAQDDKDRYPDRVDCYNIGPDLSVPDDAQQGPTPLWHCVTALHKGVQLKNWSVKCEGYSWEGDPYILKGSCWLEYELAYEQGGDEDVSGAIEAQNGQSEDSWDLFKVLLIIAVAAIIFTWWKRRRETQEQPLLDSEQVGYQTSSVQT